MQGPPNHAPSLIEAVCEKCDVDQCVLRGSEDKDKENKSPTNLLATAATTSNPVGYDPSDLSCYETMQSDLHNAQDMDSFSAEATTEQLVLGQVPPTDLFF